MYKLRNFQSAKALEGFSEKLIENHLSLYEGYVKNTNHILDHLISEEDIVKLAELRRRLGWEFDGMRLHEYFFENITSGANHDENSQLHERLSQDFGSHENWDKEFRSICEMRGIGWAILYYDRRQDRLINAWVGEHDMGHLVGCEPILVLDLFEHAYMLDYGIKKSNYIDVLFGIINWPVVEARLAVARKS